MHIIRQGVFLNYIFSAEGTNNPIQSPGSIVAVVLGVVVFIGGVILTALCVLGAGYSFYEVVWKNYL